jgi:hypothetical protein
MGSWVGPPLGPEHNLDRVGQRNPSTDLKINHIIKYDKNFKNNSSAFHFQMKH